MYNLTLITSTIYDDNEDVILKFDNYEELTNYAKTMVENYYSVQIEKVVEQIKDKG